jgi:hypothetical protein
MKRIALAFGTVAMGLSTAAYAQAPAPQQSGAAPAAESATGNVPAQPVPVQTPPPPRPAFSSRGYSLYGGPEDSRSQYPERHSAQLPHFSPLNKIPGVPDEITSEDQAREARRNAAVEFGMFRNQFTGSTQFWMDHDRTRLAKVRYAMDEPMFHSIHPDYDWGDGGYMYNTAASVGGPQWPGSSNRVIVTPPQGEPTVRQSVVRTQNAPAAPARTVKPASPTNQTPSAPLVASDRGE